MELRPYTAANGRCPFAEWLGSLSDMALLKVNAALGKMQNGNLSNTKSVGGGVLEYRIDFGPGYRLYFGRDGDILIIMLGGGDKRRQQRDIDAAISFWREYQHGKPRSRV